MLMRCRRVKAILGLTRYEFEKLVDAGVLHPMKLRPKSKAYYRTSDVMKLADGIGATVKQGEHDENRPRRKNR